MKARGLQKLVHKNSNDGLLNLYHSSSNTSATSPHGSPGAASPTATITTPTGNHTTNGTPGTTTPTSSSSSTSTASFSHLNGHGNGRPYYKKNSSSTSPTARAITLMHKLGLHKVRARRMLYRVFLAVGLLLLYLYMHLYSVLSGAATSSPASSNSQVPFSRSTGTSNRDLRVKQQQVLFTPNQPELELDLFLREFPTKHSPGAVFIQYLQDHLYSSTSSSSSNDLGYYDNANSNTKSNVKMTDEAKRWKACRAHPRQPWQLMNSPLCFAGEHSYQAALQNVQNMKPPTSGEDGDGTDSIPMNPMAIMANTPLMEQHTPVLLATTSTTTTTDSKVDTSKTIPTVYELRRYGNYSKSIQKKGTMTTTQPRTIPSNISDQFIPNLGTPMACLPLILAGAATAVPVPVHGSYASNNQHPLVVELGPYFGLSSKCIATGFRFGQQNHPILQPRPYTSLYRRGTNGMGIQRMLQTLQGWFHPTPPPALSTSPPPPPRQPLLFSYDTFNGVTNLRSLQNRPNTQWILDTFFPNFVNDTTDTAAQSQVKQQQLQEQQPLTKRSPPPMELDTDFQFLWERAVWPVYPNNAHAIAGSMETTQLHTVYERALLDDSTTASSISVSLLVMDSAKSAQAWNQQWMAVLGPDAMVHPGTILFLMDFEYVAFQVKQVYGCLRQYLLPIYISWNMEHWAFVVTGKQPISLVDQKQCYVKIAKNITDSSSSSSSSTKASISSHLLDSMEEQLKADLEFVSHGLQQPQPSNDKGVRSGGGASASNDNTKNHVDPLREAREELQAKMIRNLRDRPEQWEALARL